MRSDNQILLKKIPPKLFNKLECALNRDQSWEKIIHFLKISESCIPNTPLQSPGKKLLFHLLSLEFTVKNLIDTLYKCELYDALSLLHKEKLTIKKQTTENLHDNKMTIRRGNNFVIEFLAWGIPQPTYQWYKDEIILPDQVSAKLIYNSYTSTLEGKYYVIAIQSFDDGTKETLKSNTVTVATLPEPCIIVKNLFPEMYVYENEPIFLETKAEGYPEPKYEWEHENKLLKNDGNCLRIARSSKNYAGKYKCRISNIANEVFVETNVIILKADYLFPICKDPIVEKVALLIGNQNYDNLNCLKTPEQDVNDLAEILMSMGFLVIKASDAPLDGMKYMIEEFCKICVEGSYAFFYFAGHGFELGEKYLLPVDAPDTNMYSFQDSISENQILRDVLKRKPKLFLTLLDMCLNLPNRLENRKIYEDKKEIFEYKTERNLIQGYSTTTGLSAYEQKNAKNSIYTKFLKKYISKNLPVVKLLAKVNEDLNNIKSSMASLEQMPSVWFNIAQDHYLNAPKIGDPHAQREHAQLMQG